MEMDRISNLPGHIIDEILSHLCLRDAVRTSLLSSQWRYKWATLPYLVFDEQSVSVSTQDEVKLVSIVDHVLLLHMGPILKFKLSYRDLQCASTDIDRWILYLSREYVEEFILDIWKGHRYKLHSSLYSCQKLIHLELYMCVLNPPFSFNGFKRLKSLDLQHITMDQLAFEDMISGCPLLERLTLINFGFRILNIRARNLLFLQTGGVFDDVTLQGTFNLAVVSISHYGNEPGQAFRSSTGNMIKFFASLPRIKRLHIHSYFMKYLAAGTIPRMLPTQCVDLSFLSICINLNDMEENLAAICLLTSSPNLEVLVIQVCSVPEEQEAANIVESFPSFSFNQLRVIDIGGISGTKQEVDFINFLLANASVLETMAVKPVSTVSVRDLEQELCNSRRASLNVKKQRGLKMEVDRISNLPGHIIDEILSHLCLRDAVRTSVLSSNWRFKWATIPRLVFDEHSVLVSNSLDQNLIKAKLVSIIDHVLLLHTGSIQKFNLCHRDLPLQGARTDVDRWIQLYLSGGSVEELILDCWKGHRYKLPSCVYSCQKLTHLELYKCVLKPPFNFNGFTRLKSLDLQRITMDQLALENMISGCPLLEELTLFNFDGFKLLNIRAPNLLFLEIGGVFEDVWFQDTFKLEAVSIGHYSNEPGLAFRSAANLINFFASLPHIRRLEIQSFFIKYLAAGTIPKMLPTPFVDLSFLSICINMNDMEENRAAICLLTSSPNLEELEILATGPKAAANIVENFPSFSLNKLRLIKITGISGTKQEVNFINFLLANASVLERMTVKPASKNSGCNLVKEIVRLQRASMFAKIVYLDP